MIDRKRALLFFLWIPFAMNALLMSLYFSGIPALQQLVAPTIPSLPEDSWREFGMPEQLQNIFLLVILVLFVISIFKRTSIIEKTLFSIASLCVLFIFLEEIDYGLHYYEYITGHNTGITVRNWHNQETDGKQNVRYLKSLVDIFLLVWFIILPIFSNKITYPPLKPLIPLRWFILGFVVAVVFSRLAHLLKDLDMDIINGVKGNLRGNISEFRETSTYYLLMLYIAQIYSAKLYFSKKINTDKNPV